MSEFSDYGGLTSQTGSVGGGEGTLAGDRGILFPEFNQWALANNVILKTNTKAKQDKKGISEVLTMDIIFQSLTEAPKGDGLWRPSSTVLGNEYLPSQGDEHPTIQRCYLRDISITNYNNNPDHFRATLNYAPPEQENDSGGGGSSGGGSTSTITPLDTPFLINWTPTITNVLLKDDLSVPPKPVMNVNGEPYELYKTKVRLDGTATWTQRDWDQDEATEWTNVINSNTWEEDEYKFKKETILCHYVVGNLKFYFDTNGKRIAYYEMQAGISYDSDGWGIGEGVVEQRSQGSFYYNINDFTVKLPANRSSNQRFDLDAFGGLKSNDIKDPTVPNPDMDTFKVYTSKNFNFVDLSR